MKSTEKVWTILACVCALFRCAGYSPAADWNQWRGPQGTGVAPDSPAIVRSLPASGILPIWQSEDSIPSGGQGGWGSPVVADGCVFLFAHEKTKVSDEDLPPAKFPYLAPEKRTSMSEAEYEQYERNRRDEQETRSKNFRFDERVYCLDLDNGKTRWRNEMESLYCRFPQSGTPAVIEKRIYVLGAGRRARCVDAVNGKSLWETRLPGEFRDEFLQSSICVADGVAIVVAQQVFGLDASNGKVLWQLSETKEQAGHASPVVFSTSNEDLVIVHVGRETVCLDPHDGSVRWRVESHASHSTPVVIENRLLTYGGSRKSGLRCFEISAREAREQWVFNGSADSGSSPVVANDLVFVQGERRLACVDLSTGKSHWMTLLQLDRPRYASLVAADGMVFYAWDGLLGFAADPNKFLPKIDARIDDEGRMAEATFFREKLGMRELERTGEGQVEAEKLWKKTFRDSGPLNCTTPAIADGRLYLRTKSRVICYDLARRPGKEPSARETTEQLP
ncbi:MAG: PQQ-like beta-propeller repeat protein [Planctomycetales bacterium]|nr:PQQ-like beta-propeller repeat protein [Planctomycetales bacterium]